MPKRKSNDPFGFGDFGFGNFDLGLGGNSKSGRSRSSDNGIFGFDFGFGSGSSSSNNTGFFGQKTSKKQRQSENAARIREQGRTHQNQTEISYRMQGWEVTPRKTGCDFEATRYNPLTGRTEHKWVECKSSQTAPMRPLQKKMQKKKRSHYTVERGGSFW